MRIEEGVIKQVAALARLEVPPEQVPSLSRELSAILDYVDQLSSFDASSSEADEEPTPPVEHRADTPHTPHGVSLIDLAADREGDLVRVARVVNKP